jgi:hypothetical protein
LLLAERKNAYRVKGGYASLITLGWVGGGVPKVILNGVKNPAKLYFGTSST